MPDTEAALLREAKKLAKQLNIGCYRVQLIALRGMPDLLIVDRTLTYFLELKTPAGTGTVSPQQRVIIAELIDYGAVVYIVADFDLLACLMLALHAHCLVKLINEIL